MGSSNLNNGAFNCRHEPAVLDSLVQQIERLNSIVEVRELMVKREQEWVKEYIDRTMPIKSHFWILLGSLSILATFATAIQYIQKLAP